MKKLYLKKRENSIANTLMDMRLIACHPYLLKHGEPDGLPVYGEHLVTASGKMKLLDKLLIRLLQ